MEAKFIRPLIALGIPGVALGVFYLLFKKFNFQFSQIDATWTVVVVLFFLFIVGGITLFALHRWAPPQNKESVHEKEKPFEYKQGEETVTYIEKMISLPFDVVKVNATSHFLGISAEYAWVEHKYPASERIMQSLTTLDVLTKNEEYKSGQAHFDVLKIRLPNGREKEIYFDISSFFNGNASSLTNPSEFVSLKLAELYK